MILQKENESLSDAFFRWHLEFEEDLMHNRKDSKTIQTYSHVVKRLIDFTISNTAYKKIKDLDIKFIKYFSLWRDDENKKANGKILEVSTQKNDKKVLMIFFEFIEDNNDEKFVFTIKWKKLELKKEIKEIEYLDSSIVNEYLTYFEKLVKKNKDDYCYTISLCFKLALYGGFRAPEVANIQMNNFGKTYKANEKKMIGVTIYGKGNTKFTNPIPYEYIQKEFEYFKKNRSEKERLFYSKSKRNLTRFHIYRYIEEIAKEADLEKGVHIIRRTFANRLSELGVDLMDIQDLMRHSDPSTTRIYTKRSKKRMDIAASKL